MVPEGDIFVMWISNHYNYRQRIHFFFKGDEVIGAVFQGELFRKLYILRNIIIF